VLLENPLSAEEPGMTTTLLVGLLKAAALNVGRGHTDAAITEMGRVFVPRSTEATAPIYGVDRRPTADELAALNAALPEQPWHVGVVLVGHRIQPGWYGPGHAAEWSDAVDVMHAVAESMHVRLDVGAAELPPWHPGRCAELSVSGRVLGHAGELHPQVCSDWDLPPRTCAAEVDLDALIAAAPPLGPRPEFSIYPVAKEDLAFIVDDSMSAAELQDALAGSSALIESARLFDVYTGQPVPAGQKSLAFALRLRAADHTLSEDELKQAREAAVAAAAALGGSLRV
jgi:phenylalanyl-tRNA synthetase beta chain